MKKFICVILISLTCLSLTGCGKLLLGYLGVNELTDTAKGFIDDAEFESSKQKLLNNATVVSSNSHSKETNKSMQAAVKAQGTYDWWEASTWGKIPIFGGICKGWAKANRDKKAAKFENAMATDAVLQDSLLHGNGDNTSFWNKLIAGGGKVYFIWIIFILALLVLFYFFFGRKKQKGKQTVVVQSAPAPAPVPVVQPVIQAAPNPVYNAQYQKTAISDESYRRMIEDNCSKAGLDSEQLLLECNGNLEQAFQQSNTAVAMKGN